jgi:hypothetical protein
MEAAFANLNQIRELSTESKSAIGEILATILPEEAAMWIEKLNIKDGRLHGTYYIDIASVLTYENFIRLYEALGYTFKPQDWQNSRCEYSAGSFSCVYDYGYTCDPNSCI